MVKVPYRSVSRRNLNKVLIKLVVNRGGRWSHDLFMRFICPLHFRKWARDEDVLYEDPAGQIINLHSVLHSQTFAKCYGAIYHWTLPVTPPDARQQVIFSGLMSLLSVLSYILICVFCSAGSTCAMSYLGIPLFFFSYCHYSSSRHSNRGRWQESSSIEDGDVGVKSKNRVRSGDLSIFSLGEDENSLA